MPNGGLAAEIRHTEGRNTMRRLLRDHGLSIVMFGLFFVFVCGQSVMGLLDYNSTQQEHGGRPVSVVGYLLTARFWFESFQNWQSEFLAIGAMIVLSIYLRQRGSSQSKPVTAPHAQTGG